MNVLGDLFYLFDRLFYLVLTIAFLSYIYEYDAPFNKINDNFQILSLIFRSLNEEYHKGKQIYLEVKYFVQFKHRQVKLWPGCQEPPFKLKEYFDLRRSHHHFWFRISLSIWAQDFTYKYFLLHFQPFVQTPTRDVCRHQKK